MKDQVETSWTAAPLGELCIKCKTVDPRKSPDTEFKYVDVSSVSNETFSIEKISILNGREAPSRARRQLQSGDVIFATVRPTLMRVAQVPRKLDGAVCSTGYLVLRSGPDLDARFLYYSLFRQQFAEAMEHLQSGASYPAVTDAQVLRQRIPLPPLEEQKRIVAVLDQAFAALDRARAHAEANLADADELFESELRRAFAEAGTETTYATFDELCTAVTPKAKVKRKDYLPEGAYPIVSQEADLISGYSDDRDALMGLGEPVVIFGDHTRCLKYVNFDFVVGADGTKVLKPKKGIAAEYLYYGLRSQPIEESGYARHFKFLRESTLPRLPIDAQNALAHSLRAIEDMCGQLGEGYESKLGDIADLRRSLLQKAFSGQLTA